MSKESKIMIGILTLIVGGMIGLFVVFNNSGTPEPAANKDEALYRSDSFAKGAGAVKVVEFGDYQCPACGAMYPVQERLLKEMGDKFTLTYKHFPLPMHSNAFKAAEAAEAAGEQGKFWEMTDKLYTNQNDWSNSGEAASIFRRYAQDLGLDANQFKQSMDGGKFSAKISRDQNDGTGLSVAATPTYFINGKLYQGALDYESFKQAIEQAASAN